jgi:hypothetical protein
MALCPNIKNVKQTAELARPSLWQRIPSGVKKGAAVLGAVCAIGLGVWRIYKGEEDYTARLAREADALVAEARFPIDQGLVNGADDLRHRVNSIYSNPARDINPALWGQSGRNLRHASLVIESIPNVGYPHSQ